MMHEYYFPLPEDCEYILFFMLQIHGNISYLNYCLLLFLDLCMAILNVSYNGTTHRHVEPTMIRKRYPLDKPKKQN